MMGLSFLIFLRIFIRFFNNKKTFIESEKSFIKYKKSGCFSVINKL